jgi:hypothetical protein
MKSPGYACGGFSCAGKPRWHKITCVSLTRSDLQEIRAMVKSAVEPLLKPLSGETQSLRSDIKEIYGMIAELQ